MTAAANDNISKVTKEDVEFATWELTSNGATPGYGGETAAFTSHAITFRECDSGAVIAHLHFDVFNTRLRASYHPQDCFIEQGDEIAVLYYLLYDRQGYIAIDDVPFCERVVWCASIDTDEVPLVARRDVLHTITQIFGPCLIVVVPQSDFERRAYAAMGFDDLVPSPTRPRVRETDLYTGDAEYIRAQLTAMKESPSARWMVHSSEVVWSDAP